MPCPVGAWAASAPGRIALRAPDAVLTYGAWHERVLTATQRLRAAGVERGSRLALSRPNGVDLLTLLMAAFRIGAIACPLNPAFPEEYRKTLLERLGSTLGISGGGWGGGGTSGQGGLSGRSGPSGAAPPRAVWRLDLPATIIFTSGSTGAPEAAALSLRNHVEAARLSNANIPLGPGDSWLLSLPLHHVAGFGVLFRCLIAGATIVLPDPGVGLREYAAVSGAAHISLVARQLAQWLDGASAGPRPNAILLGGSAIPAPLLDRALDAGLPVHTSYGMTETASQIAATPPGATRAQLATSGRPLARDSVRIGEGGLIEVNGPTRFLGYWADGAVHAPFGEDGWFRTSDCGYFDADGFLHVTGRKDNVFIAGGENIQPEAVERALLRLPGITRAVVAPAPHPEFGATPAAFVECDGPLDPGGIREALGRVLPRFQIPRHIFAWPADLGQEGMKISRRDFAEEAERLVRQHR